MTVSEIGDFVSPAVVAELTTLKVQTLAVHRSKGIGIPFHRLGRRIVYKLADVKAYIDRGRVATADAQ